jgi:hypothetical protein
VLLLLLLLVRCRYGVTGRLQTAKIGMLSEGQKSRLIFAMMCMKVRTACAGLHCLRQGMSRAGTHATAVTAVKPHNATYSMSGLRVGAV